METNYIKFPNDKWGIVVLHNYDVDRDYRELREIMLSFGLDKNKVDEAIDVLCDYNTGMAISNIDLRMSVIFISKVTNASQFWDTALHEIFHVCTAIIDYYDIPYDSEDAAYLNGYITKELVELIGEPCY